MERRWGQVTLRGNPELQGVPGIMPGRGPAEKGRTPLPTSTASGEAPPSTGVSSASSSRSVARLYSTICQTVGAPTQVRQRGLRAPGPAPAPLASLQCGPLPSGRPGSLAWVPPTLCPSSSSPLLREPEPLPDAACPSASPSPVFSPGARGPHSRCRRPAPAAQGSWWSQGPRHLRAPNGWPSPRPRPQPPARPGRRHRRRRRRQPSQLHWSPWLGSAAPALLRPPSPRGAAPGVGGRGEGEERSCRARPSARRRPDLALVPEACPAELRPACCPSLSEPTSRNAGDSLSASGSAPHPATPSRKPP